jgi:hypothetical protein
MGERFEDVNFALEIVEQLGGEIIAPDRLDGDLAMRFLDVVTLEV